MASVINSQDGIADPLAEQIRAHPDAFLGPWFFSLIGVTLMMGGLVTQTIRYFSTFGYESPQLFWLVASSVVLSVAHWILLMIMEWSWSVEHFGDWGLFERVSQDSVPLPLLGWLIVFVSQLFFASRCYALYNRNKLLFGTLLFGMTASLALFVTRTILRALPPHAGYIINVVSISGLAVSVATDTAITGLTLWKIARGSTLYSARTQHGLQRLQTLTLQAAVPPTIGVILNISFCRAMVGKGYVDHFFAKITPMLYVFSMVYTLNSRPKISTSFNPPISSDDEKLSTGFQFANGHISMSKMDSEAAQQEAA